MFSGIGVGKLGTEREEDNFELSYYSIPGFDICVCIFKLSHRLLSFQITPWWLGSLFGMRNEKCQFSMCAESNCYEWFGLANDFLCSTVW